MSSSMAFGMYAVTGGRRVSSHNATTNKATTHILYDTAIQLQSGSVLPFELRMWAAASAPIFPDNTVVFTFGRAYFPAGQTALLDAFFIKPFNGDPSSDEYEDAIPDETNTWLMLTGHTAGSSLQLDDNVSVGYAFNASEFVRDHTRLSAFRIRFDAARVRWRSLSPFKSGSALQVTGIAHSLSVEGFVVVDVEHLTIGVGSAPVGMHMPTAIASASPGKQRRFARAVVSPLNATVTPVPPPVPGPSNAPGTALAIETALTAGIPIPPPVTVDDAVPDASEPIVWPATPTRDKKSGKRKAAAVDDNA